MQVFLGILVAIGYLVSPTVLIWGWVRWVKRPMLRTLPTVLSLTGFSLATASAVLAVTTAAYALLVRSFPFYDPLLMRIYAWGSLLALGGIVLGIAGIWRPNSLRWHAPVSGVCLLVFWIVMASGE